MSFVLVVVGTCWAGLYLWAVGSCRRGRRLPVELHWESGISEVWAPSVAVVERRASSEDSIENTTYYPLIRFRTFSTEAYNDQCSMLLGSDP